MKYEWSNTLDEFLQRLQEEGPENYYGLEGVEKAILKRLGKLRLCSVEEQERREAA